MNRCPDDLNVRFGGDLNALTIYQRRPAVKSRHTNEPTPNRRHGFFGFFSKFTVQSLLFWRSKPAVSQDIDLEAQTRTVSTQIWSAASVPSNSAQLATPADLSNANSAQPATPADLTIGSPPLDPYEPRRGTRAYREMLRRQQVRDQEEDIARLQEAERIEAALARDRAAEEGVTIETVLERRESDA